MGNHNTEKKKSEVLLWPASSSHVWVLAWEAAWNLEEKRELGEKDETKTKV